VSPSLSIYRPPPPVSLSVCCIALAYGGLKVMESRDFAERRLRDESTRANSSIVAEIYIKSNKALSRD